MSQGTFGRRPFNKTYPPSMLAEIERMTQPGSSNDELRLIREELQALRAALLPPSSVILTGKDVIAAFERLIK